MVKKFDVNKSTMIFKNNIVKWRINEGIGDIKFFENVF